MKPSKLALAITAVVLLAGSITGAREHGMGARVYVTNSKGDDITIIDAPTMKVVGSIKVGDNPHGLIAS
ncbi:MAG TPA: hypothetical protein VLR92_09040, partial [Blastocatellia bacterium]|nr:hypothetical protein [Blastocatellia bacterium]